MNINYKSSETKVINNILKKQRIELEHKVRDSLVTLEGDLAGTYRSLVDMSKEEKDALIEEHILFNDGDDK